MLRKTDAPKKKIRRRTGKLKGVHGKVLKVKLIITLK